MSYSERIVPDEVPAGILALHLKRYEFARVWSADAEVLDAGCGAGYGSALLAQTAERVVGVDWSPDALAYARAHYGAPNLEFVQADVLALPFRDASFDVVCAFETIEHTDDEQALLREVARVLRPSGAFIVSTPRADRTTREPKNPFHRVEWSVVDFERLLEEHFDRVDLYGQRRLQTRRHRLLQRLDIVGLRRRLKPGRTTTRILGTAPTAEVGVDGIVIERERLERASELVAVCTRPRRA